MEDERRETEDGRWGTEVGSENQGIGATSIIKALNLKQKAMQAKADEQRQKASDNRASSSPPVQAERWR